MQVCQVRRLIDWWTTLRSTWWCGCIASCSARTWLMTRNATWQCRLASAAFTGSRRTCSTRRWMSLTTTWEICWTVPSLVSSPSAQLHAPWNPCKLLDFFFYRIRSLQCLDAVGWVAGEHPACKNWVMRYAVVICQEWGANDLRMVQLMPLPPHHLLLQ